MSLGRGTAGKKHGGRGRVAPEPSVSCWAPPSPTPAMDPPRTQRRVFERPVGAEPQTASWIKESHGLQELISLPWGVGEMIGFVAWWQAPWRTVAGPDHVGLDTWRYSETPPGETPGQVKPRV